MINAFWEPVSFRIQEGKRLEAYGGHQPAGIGGRADMVLITVSHRVRSLSWKSNS